MRLVATVTLGRYKVSEQGESRDLCPIHLLPDVLESGYGRMSYV